MSSIIEKIHGLGRWVSRPKTKKRIYAGLVFVVLALVLYRFVMIGIERRMFVFNPARQVADSGLIVDTMIAEKSDGVLRIPLTVKNNRALVSGPRARMLSAGQTIITQKGTDEMMASHAQSETPNGKILAVSSDIDIDTGLHVVRTSNVPDGLHSVAYRASGYFVPAYAVMDNIVYVVDNNTATPRTIRRGYADADTVVITDGLNEGDIIILSRVRPGDRVQLHK